MFSEQRASVSQMAAASALDISMRLASAGQANEASRTHNFV